MKDLTGQRFGRLTAIKPTNKRSGGMVVWQCSCDCGEMTFVAIGNLSNGNVQSCGCLRREKMSKDLTGKQFGRLTVLQKTTRRDSSSHIVWKCKCHCGKICYVGSSVLLSKKTQSCGCLHREKMARTAIARSMDFMTPEEIPDYLVEMVRLNRKIERFIKQER